MMEKQIIVKKRDILSAINDASQCAKNCVATKSCVTLEVENGSCCIYGASTSMKIKKSFLCVKSSEGFQCTLGASILEMAIGRMPGDTVSLTMEQGGLTVSCGTARVTLPIMEYTPIDMQFGPVEKGKEKRYVIDGLAKYTNQVVHALAAPGIHPMMEAVHIEIFSNQGFRITAVDGRRFAIRDTAGKEAIREDEFNVRGRDFSAALKMMGDGPVSICKSDNYIRMEKEGLMLILCLADGMYFDVDRYRERDFPIHLMVDRGAFVSAVNLIQLVSRKADVDISTEGILFHGKDVMGETQMFVPADVLGLEEGRVFKAAFDVSLLFEAVKSILSDKICCYLKDPNRQVCFTDGKSSIEVVLPVHRSF